MPTENTFDPKSAISKETVTLPAEYRAPFGRTLAYRDEDSGERQYTGWARPVPQIDLGIAAIDPNVETAEFDVYKIDTGNEDIVYYIPYERPRDQYDSKDKEFVSTYEITTEEEYKMMKTVLDIKEKIDPETADKIMSLAEEYKKAMKPVIIEDNSKSVQGLLTCAVEHYVELDKPLSYEAFKGVPDWQLHKIGEFLDANGITDSFAKELSLQHAETNMISVFSGMKEDIRNAYIELAKTNLAKDIKAIAEQPTADDKADIVSAQNYSDKQLTDFATKRQIERYAAAQAFGDIWKIDSRFGDINDVFENQPEIVRSDIASDIYNKIAAQTELTEKQAGVHAKIDRINSDNQGRETQDKPVRGDGTGDHGAI